jgi:hypothetical protein
MKQLSQESHNWGLQGVAVKRKLISNEIGISKRTTILITLTHEGL